MNEMIPKVLQTQRLTLRPFEAEDAASVLQYWQSDTRWERFNASVPENFGLSDAQVFVRSMQDRDRATAPNWAIVRHDVVVGVVSLTLESNGHIATVGYGVHGDVAGQGLSKEAVSAVIECAFNQLPQLKRIRARTDAENQASIRVLQKLGFSHEGTLRKDVFVKGRFVDEAVYGLLRDEWVSSTQRICICGSMTFIDEMEMLATDLSKMGYQVDTPVREEQSLDWQALSEEQALSLKRSFIDGHLSKIKQADLVLVANYPKHGVSGYIGANTLMEAAFAHATGTSVAYLHPLGDQPCRLEALSISSNVIANKLSAIADILR